MTRAEAERQLIESVRDLLSFINAPESIPVKNLRHTLAALDALADAEKAERCDLAES